MPYLFDHLDSLRELLALSPLGLITDVDGTISEIAPSPDEARVSPICRQQLAALAGQLELVAAISGRPAAQAWEMVGVDAMVYIGNHGLERWRRGAVELREDLQEYPRKVISALTELEALLALEGIALENKGIAFSIHYRRCPSRESARELILEKVANTKIAMDFQVTEGRMVVELRPKIAVNKGTAVLELVERYRLRVGIYLGDDISDVDAFNALHLKSPPFKGLALGVIGKETPSQVERGADFTLNGVSDVEQFLKWLTENVPAPRR